VCLEDAPDAVAVEAAVGDVIVFSSLTPHCTGPNRTADTRKAYILQYAPDGAAVLSDGVDGQLVRTPADHPARQYAVLGCGTA
jgi:ectoine hydroxylase-related dioxygenase (phytanoyl-CoA dioxygenase family)